MIVLRFVKQRIGCVSRKTFVLVFANRFDEINEFFANRWGNKVFLDKHWMVQKVLGYVITSRPISQEREDAQCQECNAEPGGERAAASSPDVPIGKR